MHFISLVTYYVKFKKKMCVSFLVAYMKNSTRVSNSLILAENEIAGGQPLAPRWFATVLYPFGGFSRHFLSFVTYNVKQF